MVKVDDIKHYIVGTLRHRLYWSWFRFLLPKHIIEQFHFRVRVMNRECYNRGTCVKCGCNTTALQMANKKCDGDCYPPMMSKSEWAKFKRKRVVVIDGKAYSWKKYSV